jgi:hypothetical protein
LTVLQALLDRRFPPHAVHQIGLDDALCVFDAPAMAGEIKRFVPLKELFQGTNVGSHIPLWRCHDCRAPAHNVIARKQDRRNIQ